MADIKKKYLCLIPTDGYSKGDIREMTEEEFEGQNAGEKTPRFAPAPEEASEAPLKADEPTEESEPAKKKAKK